MCNTGVMPIPPFIVNLRQHVGQAELWLTGVTSVITRDDEVLLIKSVDHDVWAPVTGILEPGEQPADTAAREAWEEAGVRVRPVRLAQTSVTGLVTHGNGDQARYLDLTFHCVWESGDPVPDGEETRAAQWFPREALPEMKTHMRARLDAALSDAERAEFEFNPDFADSAAD